VCDNVIKRSRIRWSKLSSLSRHQPCDLLLQESYLFLLKVNNMLIRFKCLLLRINYLLMGLLMRINFLLMIMNSVLLGFHRGILLLR
jgi:hypothetical protein